jgi:hypothetical protein
MGYSRLICGVAGLWMPAAAFRKDRRYSSRKMEENSCFQFRDISFVAWYTVTLGMGASEKYVSFVCVPTRVTTRSFCAKACVGVEYSCVQIRYSSSFRFGGVVLSPKIGLRVSISASCTLKNATSPSSEIRDGRQL